MVTWKASKAATTVTTQVIGPSMFLLIYPILYQCAKIRLSEQRTKGKRFFIWSFEQEYLLAKRKDPHDVLQGKWVLRCQDVSKRTLFVALNYTKRHFFAA